MMDRTVEFPSCFELWDFVVSFEDGSLPIAAWNDQTLAVIAVWYLFLLSPAEAAARLELGLERNRARFGPRVGGRGGEVASLADVWPRVLRQVLAALGAGDPVVIANRMMDAGASEARDRAA